MTSASPWLKSNKPLLMGVLNCTPDSFSDGGRFFDTKSAIIHAKNMVKDGASMIDVGGESTRPGAKFIAVQEEIDRVIPVVQQLSAEGIYVSIDTSKPEVMREAVKAGAKMINDVHALQANDAIEVAVKAQVDVCLMHKQGKPSTMQQQPCYVQVVAEVRRFLQQRMQACIDAGMQSDQIIIDPGIGFGKSLTHNLELQVNMQQFTSMCPVLLGVSRKSFLGDISGAGVAERELETAAALSIAVWQGVNVLRVHDVAKQKKALEVAYQLREAHVY